MIGSALEKSRRGVSKHAYVAEGLGEKGGKGLQIQEGALGVNNESFSNATEQNSVRIVVRRESEARLGVFSVWQSEVMCGQRKHSRAWYTV